VSDGENGQRARAAILDQEAASVLSPPVKRVLRLTKSVGSEGSARKVTRRSGPFREALAGLDAPTSTLGLDAARDWATAGLLADAVLELLQGADVSGKLWRRLFDAWCCLQRLKEARRGELMPLLAKAAEGDDPFGIRGGLP
jgi:hypothetical protein